MAEVEIGIRGKTLIHRDVVNQMLHYMSNSLFGETHDKLFQAANRFMFYNVLRDIVRQSGITKVRVKSSDIINWFKYDFEMPMNILKFISCVRDFNLCGGLDDLDIRFEEAEEDTDFMVEITLRQVKVE